jgi:hypothetical protein
MFACTPKQFDLGEAQRPSWSALRNFSQEAACEEESILEDSD